MSQLAARGSGGTFGGAVCDVWPRCGRGRAAYIRPVRDTTLFSHLLELMQLDTKKHIAILKFIRRSAGTGW